MALEVRASDTIGMRIKTARMAKWLSQEELAGRVHTSRNMIAMIETERRFPSVYTLMEIADALDTTTDYLLGRTDNNDSTINHNENSNCICRSCANFRIKEEVTE